MNTNENFQPDGQLAYLLLRLSLGLVICMHGVVRLAGHYQQFVNSTVHGFAAAPLAPAAVHFAALCIPPIEAILGICILAGLFTRLALIGGALFMLVLLFGTCILQNWTIVALQLFYSLLYFMLLVCVRWNRFSLDALIRRQKSG